MRKLIPVLLLAVAFLPGCVAVDYIVDPVGCGVGSHEPIFPWYPHYLWDPPRPQPTASKLAQPTDWYSGN